MPTPKKGARPGGNPVHQKLILSNLAAQLIGHRAITTTGIGARVLYPYIEKPIAKARRDDQHTHCTVMEKVPNKGIVTILFEELVSTMDSKHAGDYIRLVRTGNRKDDNASLMRIELIMEKVEKKAVVKATEKIAAEAVADEAEKVAEVAVERAGEAREEGDLAKANGAEEAAVEADRAADAAEQVVDKKWP